jgi:hypothetical protein
MLLSKIIQNLQELRSKFLQSDDNPLSDRQMLYLLNQYRAQLIRQDVEKGRPLSPYLQQEVIVDLERIDTSITANIGDNILASKVDIPKPVEGYTQDYFTFVGSPDMVERYTELNLSSINSVNSTKYATKIPRYFIRENKLFVKYPLTCTTSKVLVKGVFEEPELVASLAGKIPAFTGMNWDYPISGHILGTITKMLEESEFKFTFAIPADNENDGSQQ